MSLFLKLAERTTELQLFSEGVNLTRWFTDQNTGDTPAIKHINYCSGVEFKGVAFSEDDALGILGCYATLVASLFPNIFLSFMCSDNTAIAFIYRSLQLYYMCRPVSGHLQVDV